MIGALTYVSTGGANVFGHGAVSHNVRSVDSLAAVRADLDAESPAGPRTLDLSGHSRNGSKLLVLGRDVIDPFDPAIARWFEQLAADRVLDRLELVAVRLLGCSTAATPLAARTLRWISRTLDRPVFGTRKPIGNAHYDARGFAPAFAHLLIESDDIPHRKVAR